MSSTLENVPFREAVALEKSRFKRSTSANIPSNQATVDALPGEAAIPLSRNAVNHFLHSALATAALDELYPHLWLVSKCNSDNINALHQNAVKNRRIILNEDPNMHLTWTAERIYIKPIPICLLNYDLWSEYLTIKSGVQYPVTDFDPLYLRTSAAGFLQSYTYLIRYSSDFRIAQEIHLLPPDITYSEWRIFAAAFQHIPTTDVSKRYEYGQIRVSRLNWAVRFFQPKHRASRWFYSIPFYSIVAAIHHLLAPAVFIFASISVVLSAVQVILGAQEPNSTYVWLGNAVACNAFSVISLITILGVAGIWVLIVCIPIGVVLWQFWGAYRNRPE